MKKSLSIKKYYSGFTLIELMITVAIVGILAAIAIPAYIDYTIRAQVAEGFTLTDGAKVAVADYYANHGVFPNTIADAGYAGSSGKYVTSTTIDSNGVITATFGGEANSKITNQTVSLTPKQETVGNISWDCTSSLEAKYLPSSCTHVDASSGGNSGSGGTGGTGGSGNTGSTTPPATINPNYQATYMGGLVNYNNGALTAGGMTIAGTPNADGTYTYDAASLGYVAMSTNTSGDLVLTSDLGNGSLQNAHYYQNSDGGYTADTINVPNVGSINTILPNYGSTQPSYMSDPANQQIFANYSAAITGLVDGSNGVGSDPNYLNTYNQALSAYKNMLNQVKSSGTTLNPADSLLLSQPSN